MPLYEYQLVTGEGCEYCAEGFEVRQSMSDEALDGCPKCGCVVKRAISAPSINTRQSTKSRLSDKNLKRHGFKKLVNEGDGRFRQTL